VRLVEDYQRSHTDVPAAEEIHLVEALIRLGPQANYLEAAIREISNRRGCSQDDAFATLRALQDRNLIERQPEARSCLVHSRPRNRFQNSVAFGGGLKRITAKICSRFMSRDLIRHLISSYCPQRRRAVSNARHEHLPT